MVMKKMLLVTSLTLWLSVPAVIAQPEEAPAEVAQHRAELGWLRIMAGGFGDPEVALINRLVLFTEYFYTAGDHNTKGCRIWRSRDGFTWDTVVGAKSATPDGFGTPNNSGINTLLVFREFLYAGLWNQVDGAQLWRSRDGLTWEPVVGATAAIASGFGKLENSGITALSAFHDQLFAGTGSLYCKDGVELWASPDGVQWKPVAGERVALHTALARESKYFLSMKTFQDQLYVGTGDQRTGGSEIWRSPDGWRLDAVIGAPSRHRAGMGDSNQDMVYDLAAFKDHLYAGVLNFAHQGGALWRSPDGAAWEIVAGQDAPYSAGFGEPANIGLTTFTVYQGRLYAGLTNEQGAQVWRSEDGQHWDPFVGHGAALSGGFGNAHNRAVNSLGVFHDALYVGTHNPKEGAELWRYGMPLPEQGQSPAPDTTSMSDASSATATPHSDP